MPIFSQCRPNFIPNSSQVFPEGLVASDGRLQPGDQIIEINGADMTCATHAQVSLFMLMLMLLLMVTKVLRSIAPIKHKRTPIDAWNKRYYPGDGLPTLRSCSLASRFKHSGVRRAAENDLGAPPRSVQGADREVRRESCGELPLLIFQFSLI